MLQCYVRTIILPFFYWKKDLPSLSELLIRIDNSMPTEINSFQTFSVGGPMGLVSSVVIPIIRKVSMSNET